MLMATIRNPSTVIALVILALLATARWFVDVALAATDRIAVRGQPILETDRWYGR